MWPKRKPISVACGAGVIGALDILDRIMSTEMNDLRLCESVPEVVTYCEKQSFKGVEKDNCSWTEAGSLHQGRYWVTKLRIACSQFDVQDFSLRDRVQRQWKVGIRNIDVAKGIAAVVQMVGLVSCSSDHY